MSLVAILEAIKTSGDLQVREIDKRASEQADEFLVAARRDAQRVREGACAKEVLPAYRERARIIHRARLEGLHIWGDAREELINSALDQARERLVHLRNEKIYPRVLHNLLQEALSELESSVGNISLIWLELDPRDSELIDYLLPKMVLNLPAKFELSFKLDSCGGVIARSEDGRMVVINTLESRFERAIPVLRHGLAVLFERESEAEANLV
jgi:vacuolar-type H+-ATPase subunit E/Vma4